MNKITDLIIKKLEGIYIDKEHIRYFEKVGRSIKYKEATRYFRSCSVKNLGLRPYKRGKVSTFELRLMCNSVEHGEIELEYGLSKIVTLIKLSELDKKEGITLIKARKSGGPYFEGVWCINILVEVRLV